MIRVRNLSTFVFATLLMPVVPGASMGSSIPVAVCTASGVQNVPWLAPDGAGGAVVAWTDAATGTIGIQAHHLLGSGSADPGWPANGRALGIPAAERTLEALVTDGLGGAIAVWCDYRSGESDLYAQHVRADGSVDDGWTVTGVPLCVAPGDQLAPRAVPDGSGGAIVVWEDHRGGESADLYAQHVMANGTLDSRWPAAGKIVCAATGDQFGQVAVSDGSGGVVVAWVDLRSDEFGDVFAGHVSNAGATVGPTDGRALCSASGEQSHLTAVADGAGGAIVAWEDLRSGADQDVYAQRVLATGGLDGAWPADGCRVASGEGSQSSPEAAPDGAGGALVVWVDQHDHADMNVAAHHVLATGSLDPAWPEAGARICSAIGDQRSPAAASDGAGGAYVVWVDQRRSAVSGSGLDIFAHHLLATGAVDPTWSNPDGSVVGAESGDQDFPAIVGDGAGGASIAWVNGGDIYTRHVSAAGLIAGVPEPVSFSASAVWPNPARLAAAVRLNLTAPASARVTVHDIGGRLVRTLVRGNVAAGSRTLTWDLLDDARHPVSSGIYFVRVEALERRFVRSVAVMR